MTKTRPLLPVVSVCALVLLAACGYSSTPSDEQPVMTTSAPQAQSYIGLASFAPPKPKYEALPLLENPRATIWRPGYWAWNGSDFNWVSGEIMPRPDATATWFPDHWIHHTYGWAFVAGYWE